MFQDPNFYRLQDGIPHAETFLAEILNGYVTGPSVGVITPDRFLLREVSLEFGFPTEEHGAMRRFFFPEPQRLPGTWALLATTGGASFYHHLLEVVPRFHLLGLAGVDASKVNGWIVNGNTAEFQSSAWQTLGLNRAKVIALDRRRLLQADRLLIPSLPSHPGHTPPWVVNFLRERLLKDIPKKTGRGGLWISRKEAHSRHFIGEEAWLTKLKNVGFQEVHGEALSLRNQAELFAGAAHIAGPHGAGMANLVFATKGTHVTEFFNPRYVNTCYWTLANSASLPYTYFLGSFRPGDLPARQGDAWGDIQLDKEAAKTAMEWLANGTQGFF
jgi:capsular polysaccharide biosynthesis protein